MEIYNYKKLNLKKYNRNVELNLSKNGWYLYQTLERVSGNTLEKVNRFLEHIDENVDVICYRRFGEFIEIYIKGD